jgi:hypothetical protein
MAPALLLIVPAIPAMLAAARYLGVLPPQRPYPLHVLRYHGFGAIADVVGQRINAVFIVCEDGRHRLFSIGSLAAPDRDGQCGNIVCVAPLVLQYAVSLRR